MIDRLLAFLAEDLGSGDITSESIVPQGMKASALIIARESGVIAGLEEATALLDHFNLSYEVFKRDGEEVKKGEAVMEVRGDAKAMLRLERVVLNILARMSGIATKTSKLAGVCAALGVKLKGTRKTTPGFRYFEKKAITLGGGMPHRLGLYDEVLIKDNHLALVGLADAVNRARRRNLGKRIAVEVSSLEDAVKAIEAGADTILLDNLTPREAGDIIDALKQRGMREKVEIELSGGIDEENISDYAATGADYISLGCLTTSSTWLDLSMKMKRK